MLLQNTQGNALQYGITAACGAGFLLFGYDQGVFGGLLDNEAFLRTFGFPGATIQGQIVATYDIGCIIGTLLSMYAGDRLGRRRCILIGCIILIVGAILQTASYSLAQMITGRVVAGIGNGMNTIAIPIWQTETARPKDRGKLIVFQLVTNIFGIVITNWMNYGFTFVPHSSVSWRFPLAFQCFFSIITIALVLVTPESPRWLIMKNRISEAQKIHARLLSKPDDHPSVVNEIHNLVAAVHHDAEVQKSVALKEIFTRNSKQQTLRRMLLGAGTAFFQQVGGTNVIAYYLPVVLTRSVGLSTRMALILSAVDSMSLMFWGSIAALLIDRVGRKKLMLMGVSASCVCFALVAVGLRYGGPGNKGMSIMAVVFIFVYYVFYGMSLLSIPYIYPAEINSQKMRNIGTSFATTINWLFVYVVVVATPTAIQNIQWRYYMLYAIFNFTFIPLIYYFYVETATLSLEQVDRLFEIKHNAGKDMSWTDAARIARTEGGDPRMSGGKDDIDAEHCEDVS
ncbi:general substrate transporter [Aspergillus eucalypticola CBS 122712]|uniref:General substrate transporter n=1 Tax=Aspergillus eucalypticola (strain CBS 122712 / IBT 29274) TaxID=1448314 RepID=A0A317UUX8_ASPEC|nr:general substrate transporter [Aspergillus eucalypticola CBS 122712]PWY65415.1 general substrate transporter [Aspergillus eucalypticola CBS 122712]